MTEEEMHFNLVDQPWMQVECTDGTVDTVSLRDALSRASTIRGFAGELPQMSFTQIRLLLAVLYRAYGTAYDLTGLGVGDLIEMWRDIWQQRAFDGEVLNDYLAKYYDRFDLFDDAHPFYQTASLQYEKGGASPINIVMPDAPKQDKTLFSMRSLAFADELRFAEAARFLILTQAFDVAGIKGAVVGNSQAKGGKVYAPKGLSGTGWCGNLGGTFLEGHTLFETLMLNWVLYSSDAHAGALIGIADDLPAWERDKVERDVVKRDPKGIVDMFTWQSRRIRLVRTEEGTGVCGAVLCYGDITSPVEKAGFETMTPWKRSEAQRKKLDLPYVPRMPKPHVAGRSLWRGLSSMLAIEDDDTQRDDLRPEIVKWAERLRFENMLPADYPLAIHAQGMEYGTQASVFTDSIDDFIDMDALLLNHEAPATNSVLEVIGATEDAVRAFVRFSVEVLVSTGDRRRFDKFDDKAATGVKEDARSIAYDHLDGLFRRRIAALVPDTDLLAYRASWEWEAKGVLLRLAHEQLQLSGALYFAGAEGRTAGLAFTRYQRALNKIFALADQEKADVTEGKEGHNVDD